MEISLPPGPWPPADWDGIYEIPGTDIELFFARHRWEYNPDREEGTMEGIFEEIQTKINNEPQIRNHPMRFGPYLTHHDLQYFQWRKGNTGLLLFVKMFNESPSNITWSEMSQVLAGLDAFYIAYPKLDYDCEIFSGVHTAERLTYLGFIEVRTRNQPALSFSDGDLNATSLPFAENLALRRLAL